MRRIIVISLFFFTLSLSGFVYAASDQPSAQTCKVDNSSGANHSTPTAVFAGPKVGWLKMPVEEKTSGMTDSIK